MGRCGDGLSGISRLRKARPDQPVRHLLRHELPQGKLQHGIHKCLFHDGSTAVGPSQLRRVDAMGEEQATPDGRARRDPGVPADQAA